MKRLHTKSWSLQSIFHVDRSRRSYFVNNLFILKFNCFFSFSFHVVFANEWTLDHYTWSAEYMIADETESGIGLCGWILTAISWGLVMVTLPFSLCVCFKVIQSEANIYYRFTNFPIFEVLWYLKMSFYICTGRTRIRTCCNIQTWSTPTWWKQRSR